MDEAIRMNQEIGERIRDARMAKKMSQQELATKANISLPHFSDIEHGKQSMKLITFVRIIEALQVSADEILRADVPAVYQLYQNEFSRIVEDCTPAEIESLKRIPYAALFCGSNQAGRFIFPFIIGHGTTLLKTD